MESNRLFFFGLVRDNDDDTIVVIVDEVETIVDDLLVSFDMDVVVTGWAVSSSPKCNCPFANSTCANMARFSAALIYA